MITNNLCKQGGRSMIEMLGVLAIIGVLSAGGIAGYSFAMESWKINKTLEAIGYFAAQSLSIYKSTSETSEWYYAEDLCSLHLLPEDICNAKVEERDEDYRKGYFGEELYPRMGLRITGQTDPRTNEYGETVVVQAPWIYTCWDIFSKIPPSACVKLVTSPMWLNIGIFTSVYQLGGQQYILPLDTATASAACLA